MINLAEKNGINKAAYRARLRMGWDERLSATKPVKGQYQGEIAVYKNDDLLTMGSYEECATELGLTVKYLRWLTTPSGKKRGKGLAVIKLDEDDE